MENFPALSEDSLRPYFNKADLIKQAIEQVKKDFDLLDSPIVIDEKSSNLYLDLVNIIEPLIAKLMDGNYQKLLELLYRIDIYEGLIADTVNNSGRADLANEITRLIILRELQKVVIRNYYR